MQGIEDNRQNILIDAGDIDACFVRRHRAASATKNIAVTQLIPIASSFYAQANLMIPFPIGSLVTSETNISR